MIQIRTKLLFLKTVVKVFQRKTFSKIKREVKHIKQEVQQLLLLE